MAYTVVQSPENWVQGSKYPIIYVVYDDTNTGEAKYKYICDIYVGGSKVARLKTLPNSNDRGVFQVNRILDDYVTPTAANVNSVNNGLNLNGVITLGVEETAKPFGKNTEATRRVEFKFGYEYATSATSAPTIYEDQITGNYVSVIKAHGYFGVTETLADQFEDSDLKRFQLDSSLDPFISAVPRVSGSASIISSSYRYDQDVHYRQAHVLSFLNDETSSTQTKGPNNIFVAGYEADGTEIFNSYIANLTANGGEAPGTSNSDDERLLYFGAGPHNLTTQTNNALISAGMADADLAYYEVVACDTTTLSAINQVSAVYRFNIVSECKYETRRVMFQNQYGGWDFLNFEKRSERKLNYERSEYYRPLGNWDTAQPSAEDWGYTNYAQGRSTLMTRTTLKETLNTDWLPEHFNPFFEALLASPKVYLIEQKQGADLYQIPAVITNTDHVRKTGINDSLITYSIEVEYSRPLHLG